MGSDGCAVDSFGSSHEVSFTPRLSTYSEDTVRIETQYEATGPMAALEVVSESEKPNSRVVSAQIEELLG